MERWRERNLDIQDDRRRERADFEPEKEQGRKLKARSEQYGQKQGQPNRRGL